MLNIALRTGIGTPPHMYAGREGIDAIDREICEWEIGRRVHAAKQVHCYLKDRAAVEGVPFDLDDSFFAEMVLSGVFSFFGVTISDAGLDFGIEDERQPKRGFLKRWLKRNCPPQKAAH